MRAKYLVTQLCLTLCDPMEYNLPGSSVRGISQQEYWSELLFSSPGHLPNSGIEPGSPTLQADSLPSEPAGKQILKFLNTRKETVTMCGEEC